MFVLYNCYGIDLAPGVDEILTPYHTNPKYNRWELHRVWEVEATLKKGERHIYSKRVFYLDEDSWNILAKDQYDSRDGFWRMGLASSKQRYNFPAYHIQSYGHWDFQTDSYTVSNMKNGCPRVKVVDIPSDHLTPQYLRQMGNR